VCMGTRAAELQGMLHLPKSADNDRLAGLSHSHGHADCSPCSAVCEDADVSTEFCSDVEEFERIAQLRWECQICLQTSQDLPGGSLWTLRACGHEVCYGCVRRSIEHLRRKCPVCATELDPIDVVAHSSERQWIAAEQDAKWKASDFQGIRCSLEGCHGVIVDRARHNGGTPEIQPVECDVCRTGHCARCGEPWGQGHRCQDLLQAEQELQAAEAAARPWWDIDAHDGGPPSLRGCCAAFVRCFLGLLHPLPSRNIAVRAARTKASLLTGKLHKPCPHCAVMTYHDGGCNIMACTMCTVEWCFVCGRTQADSGCRHFVCVSSQEPAVVEAPDEDVEVHATRVCDQPGCGLGLAHPLVMVTEN